MVRRGTGDRAEGCALGPSSRRRRVTLFRHLTHLPGVTDARELLQGLVGRQLRTISQGKPNTVLRVDAETVLVGTGVSPDGRSIPIEWLQDALDVLDRDGELRFDRSLYWYGAPPSLERF